MRFTDEQVRAAEEKAERMTKEERVNCLLAVQAYADDTNWCAIMDSNITVEPSARDWFQEGHNGSDLALAALSGKLYPQEVKDEMS